MARGKTSPDYSIKGKGGTAGARVARGASGPVKGRKQAADYSSKGSGGTAGARVLRGK